MSANPDALPGWFNRRVENDEQSASPQLPGEADSDAENTPLSTTTQAVTGGGKDDQTPVVVWNAANRMEAEIVAGRLFSEGIPTIIRGEALGTIYGLTTGSLAAATVLVPAALAEKAMAILSGAVEWDEHDGAEFDDLDAADLDPDHEQSNRTHEG